MNNDELDALLRRAKTPERSEEYWREFPTEVTREIRRRPQIEPESKPQWALWKWLLPVAATCVAAGFLWGFWHRSADGLSTAELERHQKVYRELAGMFPDQIRAILISEEGVQLELKDSAGVPSSMPILLKTCSAEDCRVIISFSGEKIPLNGVEVEVLVTARDEVILVGVDDVWQSGESAGSFHGYRIDAHPLEVL